MNIKNKIIDSNSFYCQKKCRDVDFSIDKWNNAFKMCIDMDLSEKEMSKIIEGDACKTQCDFCVCIVGEQRIKTKKLIKNINRYTVKWHLHIVIN